MRVTFLIFLAAWTCGAAAHIPEDGDVRATFGSFVYRTMTPQPAAISMDPALIVEADLHKRGGLEIGLFYLRNAFYLRQDGHVLAESVKRIYISTGYRHWFTEKFGLGLGFSSSYTIGDYRTVKDDYGAILHPDTSAHDTTEYGLDLSAQYEPIKWERFSLVLDGRYGFSVTAKRKEDAHHFGAFIGIKYFVQSRQTELSEEN